MPAKARNQQPKESGGKREKKRKAKSPLLVDNGQGGQTGSKEGGVSDTNINKRQYIREIDFMASPINTIPNMTSPNTSYTLPYPSYPMPGAAMIQNPQNPQFFQPMASGTPVGAQTGAQTPPWAQEILNELKRSISKIDGIEKKVDVISTKMVEMESRVTDIEKRTTETEKSCAFISETTESHQTQLQKTKQEVNTFQNTCKSLNEHVKSLETERQRLNTKINDLEFRSMRDNLLFYGLPEERGEDCEAKIKNFIQEKLEIREEIQFDRVHRIGQATGSKPRPIVAKFHEHKKRELVRQQAFDSKTTLKQLGYGVGVQYPKDIRETRKLLYPIMKKAENEGKTVKMVGDKLFINHTLYVIPSERPGAT